MRFFRPYSTLLIGVAIGAFAVPWAAKRFNLPIPTQ